MANLAQSTRIGSGGLSGSYATAGTMQLGIYNYRLSDADRTSRYLHFKTNVPKDSNRMVMIEAVGYDYNGGRPIRCAWSWYTYSGTGLLVNVGLQNLYPGLVPNSVYYSTDNFACFSSAAQDLYFIGVTLNAYTVNPSGAGLQVQITAAGTTTSAGALY